MNENDRDRAGLSGPDADDETGTTAEEVQKLREALSAKTREAEASQDRYLRAAAEFDNAKKRAARDREELTRTANESLLRDLLPVLDNLDRALLAARKDPGAPAGRGAAAGEPSEHGRSGRGEPTANALAAGVELIQRELLRVLERYGVTPFTSVGAPFDPARHEAIARVPAQGQPEMTVVDETARGYLLHARVLRPASVTVAMSPEPSGADSGGDGRG